MRSQSNLFFLILLICSTGFFGSCKKENLDVTTGDQDTIPVDTIICNLALDMIFVDSVSLLYANAMSGVAPYQYIWSDGSTTDFIEILSDGTYSVTVVDADSCIVEGIEEVMLANLCENFATEIMVTDSMMYDKIAAFSTGGLPPYAYLWSEGSTTQEIEVTLGQSYSVTSTDANGCTAEDDIDL